MTTITTAMLRYIAHTLNGNVAYTARILRIYFNVTIDDTPADTEEQAMAMTITQEQANRIADSLAANRVRTVDVLTQNGITPAEPPAEMVKLAREIAAGARHYAGIHSDACIALAALQHAVDVVKGAQRYASVHDNGMVRPADILNALGAGGRDAG